MALGFSSLLDWIQITWEVWVNRISGENTFFQLFQHHLILHTFLQCVCLQWFVLYAYMDYVFNIAINKNPHSMHSTFFVLPSDIRHVSIVVLERWCFTD